jgi:hypothetical protein
VSCLFLCKTRGLYQVAAIVRATAVAVLQGCCCCRLGHEASGSLPMASCVCGAPRLNSTL